MRECGVSVGGGDIAVAAASTRGSGAPRSGRLSPGRDDAVFPQELFSQLCDPRVQKIMEGMDRPLVADVPLPSPDRAGIRVVDAAPAHVVVGPVGSQEFLEDVVMVAVIEAREFQIALRLGGDAPAPLPVLLLG